MDKPTIQYVVEEAVASGIDDIIIITGRGKRAIEDHFDRSVELEHYLKEKGKLEDLAEIQRISDMADIHYIRQKEQRGLGDAIACAKKHVEGGPFAVLLGDDIIISKVPATKQLIEIHEKHDGANVVALERHKGADISKYGAIKGKQVAERTYRIETMVEKPTPVNAPSDLAVMGRYILRPEVFDFIDKLSPGIGGEIQITDALSAMAANGNVFGYEFIGKRYDIGSKIDYLKATIELALAREDLGGELRTYMKGYTKPPKGF